MSSVADAVRGLPPARGAETQPAAPVAQRTVLVIDDEEAILSLVKRVLSPKFSVLCAQNTREADAVLQAQPVHVVVCDLHMPGESGLDFLVRLRQSHPLVSRILLTGCAEPAAILAAVNRCGVLHYFVKPVAVADLLRAVDDAARVHDAAARHAGLGKENADLRHSLHQVLARSASPHESPVKLLAVFAMGLLAILAAALLLGLLVFIILYALKSALGIDLFADWHLADLL